MTEYASWTTESKGQGYRVYNAKGKKTGDNKTTTTRPTMLLMTMQMTEHCLYRTLARHTALHKFIDTYVLTLLLELLLYVPTEK